MRRQLTYLSARVRMDMRVLLQDRGYWGTPYSTSSLAAVYNVRNPTWESVPQSVTFAGPVDGFRVCCGKGRDA